MKVFTLKKRKDFLKAAKEFKIVTNGLILQAALNLSTNTANHCFVGYTATKKLGKAHIRNKTKRRLRAAVSLVFANNALANINYVVIGRHNTSTISFDYLVENLRNALLSINQQILDRKSFDDKKNYDLTD
jgi:ribonuclease P protein component